MVCGRKVASYSEIQANLRGLSREQRLPSRVVPNSNYGELWFGLRGTSSFESKGNLRTLGRRKPLIRRNPNFMKELGLQSTKKASDSSGFKGVRFASDPESGNRSN